MSLWSSYLLDNLALSVDSFDKGLMNRHLGKQVQSNSVQRATSSTGPRKSVRYSCEGSCSQVLKTQKVELYLFDIAVNSL